MNNHIINRITIYVYDERTAIGYREITRYADSLEQALDIMRSYHGRSTGLYEIQTYDGNKIKEYTITGVVQ